MDKILGFDLRSLAIFRLGIGAIVIIDLWIRWGDVKAHYTDTGVIPRKLLTDNFYWSLNAISGNFWLQWLIFVVALLIAICFLVGYRTRLAAIATWVMIISLHNRNPFILFAGDDVLRALLFWSMFLPLGAAYSFDSALNNHNDPLPKRWLSGATIALIFQICYFYMWSVAYKHQSPFWQNGDAVYYSLSFDYYGTSVSQLLLSLPNSILQFLTRFTLWFELLGPLIVLLPLIPIFSPKICRYLAISLFVGLHFSFGLIFTIGLFPALGIITWLVFLPSEFWDGLQQRLNTPSRQGLTIYYDSDCGFCKKVVYLLRTLLILPKTPLLPAQDYPSIYADLERYNSWVIEDYQGNRYYKWQGLTYVVSLSPLFFSVAIIMSQKLISFWGHKFYTAIANNRQLAGTFTKPFKFRPLILKSSLTLNIITLSLFALASLWNWRTFINTMYWRDDLRKPWVETQYKLLNRRTFNRLEPLAKLTRLDQSWSIFAPNPPMDDGWYVVTATLKDGTEVDILRNQIGMITWDKPTRKERNKVLKNMQWRSYFIRLNRSIGDTLLPDYAAYLRREWNENHLDSQHIKSLTIYFMDETTVPPGEKQTVTKVERYVIQFP